MLEKYTKEEILAFIEQGYKNLGDFGSRNAAIALRHGLPAECQVIVYRHEFDTESINRFLVGLGIPRDYVPPRMLVRRYLALVFAAHETVLELERVVRQRAEPPQLDIVSVRLLAAVYKSVGDIYKLSDEQADEMLAAIFPSHVDQ